MLTDTLAKFLEFITVHYMLSGAFLIIVVLLIVQQSRNSGRNLSSRELTAMVNRDEAFILDIRPKKDFVAGHIVGSENISSDQLKTRMADLEKYKDKTIIVVCASGVNAGSACSELKKAGFNAARLSGGITGWRSENLPVVK
ncbi:rhodanese-like domain-containing protein [Denitrificimonas caeni]|uniref:Rhodanese-like domain-containing protein n=1 Tax=Denitrificimonas caeni TaxID=521720 RepID=A0AAE9VPJ8_9GAMM|nr:rhodanese-like domain-containing protein [Denitrificimonas caeni]NLJ12165.1 rhodanese-like domain-containing protein [Gammaproteobacteria bacterium]WBE25567.1 rhodanese-like domain-containing protein [Denitrificimonas caeni]